MATRAKKFDEKLVLSKWMLKQFGVEKLEVLGKTLSDDNLIGFTEENNTRFLQALQDWIPEDSRTVKNDQLRDYDDNVVKHWHQITYKRNHAGNTLYPLYFQYLSILFTEYYLDRYFQSVSDLCVELNKFLAEFNRSFSERERIQPFVESDLNKLAIWIATGGGKTLIMHINVLQFDHYRNKYGKSNAYNKTILLTPNEGLSLQHKDEMDASNLSADLFVKGGGGLLTQSSVQIIDIHKLQTQDKVGKSADGKTVAVESFETNNLVLVDEGHRGASGKDWMEKRNLLCESGFSFEYSATFGQAIKAASGNELAPTGKGNPSAKYKLVQQYSKCILFDYSYKFFHGDGYGKDHFILNLADAWTEEQTQLYLTGSILRFYQQKCLYQDKAKSLTEYLLADPLWIFVGGKVTAKNEANADTISDIQAIIKFVARFVANQSRETIEFIERFLTQTDGLLDNRSQPIFANSFPYLHKKWKTDDAENVYRDVLNQVFNAETPGILHVVHIKGGVNEIGLRIGAEEGNWFGVINVGDASKLQGMCEEAVQSGALPNCTTTDDSYSSSLFEGINKKGSTINLLVGAKKFTEGWSSWRVSAMGLMNVGRSEGSEIIQLFGRGVRLKGYDFTLKRSNSIHGMKHPEYIEQLETLNVFGIRSNYMKEFEEYLEEEGVGEQQVEVITLPVIKRLEHKSLKVIKPSQSLTPFKKACKPSLSDKPEEMFGKVTLNWYPKIQAKSSASNRAYALDVELNEAIFKKEHLAFLNTEQIYFEIAQYKNEKALYNLQLSRETIANLLTDSSWYRLLIPEQLMVVKDFERIRMWQDIAISLLKKYVERFYNFKKQEYEEPHLEYVALDESDPNFINEYKASIDVSQQEWIDKITELKTRLEDGSFSEEWKFGNLLALDFSRHQYQPLIYFKNNEVLKVSPVPLNDGERDFITDLKNHYVSNEAFYKDKELYILRNQSKGKGVGFFEAGNFYPDFIMWVIVGGVQYVTFIDPKGLRMMSGFDDPKIAFCQKIKEIEVRIDDPNVVLNSFLISNTLQTDIFWWKNGSELDKAFANHHILFQSDEDYIDVLYEAILDAKFIKPLNIRSSGGDNKRLGKLKVVVETNGTMFEADAKLLAQTLEDIINDTDELGQTDSEIKFKVGEIKPGSIEMIGDILAIALDSKEAVGVAASSVGYLGAKLEIGDKVKRSLKQARKIYPFIKRTVRGRDPVRELRIMTDEEEADSIENTSASRPKKLDK